MGRNIFSIFPWVPLEIAADGGWSNCTIRGQGEQRDDEGNPTSMGFISNQFFPTQDDWLRNLGFERGIKAAAAGSYDRAQMEEYTMVHTTTIPPRKKFFIPALIREAIALANIIKLAQSQLVEDSFNRAPNGSVMAASKILDVYGETNLITYLIKEMEANPSERLPVGNFGEGSNFSYKNAAKRLKLSYPRVLNYDPLYQYTTQGQDLAIVGRGFLGTYGKYFGKAIPSANGRTDASQYRPQTRVTNAPDGNPLSNFSIAPHDTFEGNRDGQIRFKYFTDEEYANVKRFIDGKYADYVTSLGKEDEPTLEQANESIDKPNPRLATGTVTAPKNVDVERSARVRILNGQMALMRNMADLINVSSLTKLYSYQLRDLDPKSPERKLETQRLPFVKCKSLINYLGQPESLLTLVNNPYSGLEEFINANNAELSTLVPQMTFFLVNEKGYRRKIEFPDHVHDYQIKKLAKGRSSADISDMLRSRSNHGTDAGIKSFTWDYDAKDFGQYVIKANLALFFGSALDLLNDDYKAFLDTTGQPTYGSPEIKKNGKTKKLDDAEIAKRIAKVIALRQEKCQKEDPPKEEHKDKTDLGSIRQTKFTVPGAQSLQLVVRVGWAYPEGRMPRGVSKAFKEAIRRTQREITLNLSGYDVDYSQNGQLTLNLSYDGAIDNALDHIVKADILAGDGKIDEEEVSIPKFVNPVADDPSDPEVSTQSITYAKGAWPKGYIVRKAIKNFKPGGTYSISDVNEKVTLAKSGVEYELVTLQAVVREMQKNFSRAKQKIRNKTGTDPSTGEQQNMISLIDKWKGYQKVARIALANIQERVREPKYAALINNLLLDKKIYYARIRQESSPFAAKAYGNAVGSSADKLVGAPVRNYSVSFTAKQPKGNKESKAERKKRIQDALNRASSGDNPAAVLDPRVVSNRDFDLVHGTRNLYYMRLGDILDTIINNLTLPKDDQDYFKVILGSFSPSQIGIPGFNEETNVLLADIPITLEYFGQFFIKTVVAPQRNSMSLKEFITAMYKSLLSPMIREVAKREGKRAPIFNLTTLFSGVEIDEGEVIMQMDLKRVAAQREQASMATDKYLVLGVRQVSHAARTGNEEEDTDDGIYHLKIGTDRGIVKNFSFSEMNLTSQYRAMQVEKSANNDGVLVVPQNVELTLYGNQFFPNGTLLYIDADVGFGREIAIKLGIGGYYTVIRSVHTITAGKYETVLSCRFESSGNKDI